MEIIIKKNMALLIVLLCVQCEGLPVKFIISIIIVFALISASCLFRKPSEAYK